MMKRRAFITLLGGAAAAWPLAARAQQMKRPTIGLLGGATASAQAQWNAAFVQRLRELGWVEGQTVAIEYRWVEGRFERSPEIIAEFVTLNVDVIVTHATPNVLAAKQVTSVVPIVFPSAGDPVGNRLVTSLARPGGKRHRPVGPVIRAGSKGSRAVTRPPPESRPLGDDVPYRQSGSAGAHVARSAAACWQFKRRVRSLAALLDQPGPAAPTCPHPPKNFWV
jgi:hypothetical protein